MRDFGLGDLSDARGGDGGDVDDAVFVGCLGAVLRIEQPDLQVDLLLHRDWEDGGGGEAVGQRVGAAAGFAVECDGAAGFLAVFAGGVDLGGGAAG
jgi:hypothetical protein